MATPADHTESLFRQFEQLGESEQGKFISLLLRYGHLERTDDEDNEEDESNSRLRVPVQKRGRMRVRVPRTRYHIARDEKIWQLHLIGTKPSAIAVGFGMTTEAVRKLIYRRKQRERLG